MASRRCPRARIEGDSQVLKFVGTARQRSQLVGDLWAGRCSFRDAATSATIIPNGCSKNSDVTVIVTAPLSVLKLVVIVVRGRRRVGGGFSCGI